MDLQYLIDNAGLRRRDRAIDSLLSEAGTDSSFLGVFEVSGLASFMSADLVAVSPQRLVFGSGKKRRSIDEVDIASLRSVQVVEHPLVPTVVLWDEDGNYRSFMSTMAAELADCIRAVLGSLSSFDPENDPWWSDPFLNISCNVDKLVQLVGPMRGSQPSVSVGFSNVGVLVGPDASRWPDTWPTVVPWVEISGVEVTGEQVVGAQARTGNLDVHAAAYLNVDLTTQERWAFLAGGVPAAKLTAMLHPVLVRFSRQQEVKVIVEQAALENALPECPRCGADLHPKMKKCPYCGKPLA